MADESAAWTWKGVIARLREAPTGSTVQIAVSAIEEPTSVGLHPMPTGADGRFGGVCVLVYAHAAWNNSCSRTPEPMMKC